MNHTMTLYIAGPMTGHPDLNYPAFNLAAFKLVRARFHVLNPARRPAKEGWGWLEFMRAALRDVADADGIALLPGWEWSEGAKLEHHIARTLGLPIRYVDEWIIEAGFCTECGSPMPCEEHGGL